MWSILRPYIDPWSIVFIVPIGTIKGPNPKFVALTCVSPRLLAAPRRAFYSIIFRHRLGIGFLRILEPTWKDFGTILGASWELFSSFLRHRFLNSFLIDFWIDCSSIFYRISIDFYPWLTSCFALFDVWLSDA